jgi:hypothetical protein
MSQADFSDYVVHFTKRGPPYSLQHRPQDKRTETLRQLQTIAAATPLARLVTILEQGRILAADMPWTDCPAVCFTECTWPSLLTHCDTYSPYGIGFTKAKIFADGGGPAIYMRQDHFEAQKKSFAREVFPFVTPFVPLYASAEHREKYWKDKRFPMDYTYEREWRLPAELQFTLDEIAFVVVSTHTDIAAMPREAQALPPDKWIIVSNYRKIEELWPQHNLGGAV